MPKVLCATALAVACGFGLMAADWPTLGGNPQRSGWAKSENLISRENVRDMRLLYSYKADNPFPGISSLTPPIVNGNLITYLGFKEMLLFSSSSGNLFSVDADLNKLIWQSNIDGGDAGSPAKNATLACPGGLTAPLAMAGSSSQSVNFAAVARQTPAAAGLVPPRRPSPYLPPLDQTLSPMTPLTLTRLAALYAVSGDGRLHVVNSSTGKDLLPSVPFLPANSRVSSLNIRDNVVYASTAGGCNGSNDGVYAIDLMSADKHVTNFLSPKGSLAGTAGTSIGNDGTIYVQAAYGGADPGKGGRLFDAVIALTPKDLKVKDYILLSSKPLSKDDEAAPGITPLVVSGLGKDTVLAGGRNGKLYVLDSTSLGGADHHTPVLETEQFARPNKGYDGHGFRGTFSSWLDTDSATRWVYVPLSGTASTLERLSAGTSGKDKTDGRVLALKMNAGAGQPAVEPVWISGPMTLPAPVVIANGMALVLETGESERVEKKNGKPYSPAEWKAMSRHSVLHALDAVTGKELYSSAASAPDVPAASAAALAVANGRVYFAAGADRVYCFGLPRGQSQLTEQ